MLRITRLLLFWLLFPLLLSGCASNDRNFDFWGLDAPDFDQFTLSKNLKQVENSRGARWQIAYEGEQSSTFEGKIRHISVNYEPSFPFLTHDILVTSGDFADPQRVDTLVSNHHFSWSAAEQPDGKINLLHVVVLDAGLYDQLMQLHTDDWVRIRGREILTIELHQKDRLTMSWSDSGCNTLLIEAIQLQDSP